MPPPRPLPDWLKTSAEARVWHIAPHQIELPHVAVELIGRDPSVCTGEVLAPIIRGSWRLAMRAHCISRVDGGGCSGTLATRLEVEAEGRERHLPHRSWTAGGD